jgi:UDP-glucose 4-epimerase
LERPREDSASAAVGAAMAASQQDRNHGGARRAGPVLVTGGAGFVGAALVRRLAASGRAVRVFDDLSAGGAEPALRGVEFVRGDVLDGEAVARAMDGCTLVFHLAAVVGVKRVIDDPQTTKRVNEEGTRVVVLEAARRGAALVFASSSEVYGQGRGERMHEDDEPLAGVGDSPRWVYARSKLAGERFVLELVRAGRLAADVVRFFNTTGAGQQPRSGMVLPRMASGAVHDGVIVVHGDGRQVRTFCDVSDTVRALERIAQSSPLSGTVFNIGSREPIAIGDLARLVAERTGARVVLEPHVQTFGAGFEDVRRRVPETRRIELAVGWSAQVSLAALVDAAIGAARAAAPEACGVQVSSALPGDGAAHT